MLLVALTNYFNYNVMACLCLFCLGSDFCEFRTSILGLMGVGFSFRNQGHGSRALGLERQGLEKVQDLHFVCQGSGAYGFVGLLRLSAWTL